MATGNVVKYNQLESILFSTSGRQWDDATAGNIMFCLADNTYTPSATHTTTTDVGAALIASGDGAPINATGLTVDGSTTAGTTYYTSADADFGATVTVSAKWFIAVQPVTAGTFSSTTSNLLFVVDLDTASGSAEITATASPFVVYVGGNGWFKSV